MKTVACAALVLVVAAWGCSGQLRHAFAPNQPPEIALAHESLPSVDSRSVHRVRWTATDPEGALDHFIYAVDPPSVDRVDSSWQSTTALERVVSFPASPVDRHPESVATTKTRRGAAPERGAIAAGESSTTPEPHVFVARAVDRQGAMSEPAWVVLGTTSEPPIVQITNPTPSALFVVTVPPTITIHWDGTDPDGVFSTRPVRYVYRLFSSSDPEYATIVSDPDSLRRKYAPAFDGWSSASADTPRVTYTNLTPGQNYLLAVTGFDEAGDYDPVFSLNKNILRFRVGVASTLGPLLALFNGFFNYSYPTGGYPETPFLVPIDIMAGTQLRVNWLAYPATGTEVRAFRWVLDPEALDDETPRSEYDDFRHWSPWSLSTTSADIGPFPSVPDGQVHRLYVEASDNVGGLSIGGVEISVVGAPFDRPLLIVDDTRLRPDRLQAGGALAPPAGPWPTAAELDSFLYARGGFPWQGYPAGTNSTPGIFDGYTFDTLGTRTGVADLSIPVERLARYRHVIWLVDRTGASYTSPGTSGSSPMTALRYMSGPGRVNALVQYVAAGGKVWVAGGGAAGAGQAPWNSTGNDVAGFMVSSSISSPYELIPGRFMYEAGWRSELWAMGRTPASITRFTGRFRDSASTTGAGSPYAALPARMRAKSVATDPLAPLRLSADFYQTAFDLEFLAVANSVTNEDVGVPSLDSLFRVTGSGLPGAATNPHNVAMTRLRGGGDVIFSGFNVWNFAREDCAALVDHVMRDQWGFTRGVPAARSPRAVPERSSTGPAARTAAGGGARDAAAMAGRPEPQR